MSVSTPLLQLGFPSTLPSSYLPWQVPGFIRCLFDRAEAVMLSHNNLSKERKHLRKVLNANGYPQAFHQQCNSSYEEAPPFVNVLYLNSLHFYIYSTFVICSPVLLSTCPVLPSACLALLSTCLPLPFISFTLLLAVLFKAAMYITMPRPVSFQVGTGAKVFLE